MNAAAYNAELFQTSVMHVPTKEEADRSWRTLANCDETMLRELRRQWYRYSLFGCKQHQFDLWRCGQHALHGVSGRARRGPA